jgi:hypothetical protein
MARLGQSLLGGSIGFAVRLEPCAPLASGTPFAPQSRRKPSSALPVSPYIRAFVSLPRFRQLGLSDDGLDSASTVLICRTHL